MLAVIPYLLSLSSEHGVLLLVTQLLKPYHNVPYGTMRSVKWTFKVNYFVNEGRCGISVYGHNHERTKVCLTMWTIAYWKCVEFSITM